MKKLSLVVSTLIASLALYAQNMDVSVPPSSSKIIDNYQFAYYNLTIKNNSNQDVELEIISTIDSTKTGGFGLNNFGKVELLVSSNEFIKVLNDSKKDINLSLSATETEAPKPITSSYINFTLTNKTAKSIMLYIPGVMNPNLSPISKSGVSLMVGQEVFYKNKGKKVLLLTVNKSLQDKSLEVSELVKKLKKQDKK